MAEHAAGHRRAGLRDLAEVEWVKILGVARTNAQSSR